MNAHRSTDWLALAALSLGFLYATCILPYRFPPRVFVIGASYEVGFNNAISYLGYVLFVPMLAFVTARVLQPHLGFLSREGREAKSIGRVALMVIIAAHVLLFGALYLYKGRFVFGEGLYFQSMLYRMSRGEVPYVDFSFYYGPLMLYPGYWLGRVFGLYAGYGIWFVTTYVIGLIFLYQVVSVCVSEDLRRAAWFVFLALGLFNPLTGLNETFTRFLLPTVVFLAANRFLLEGGTVRGLMGALALSAAFTYSFEVAALSAAAVLVLGLLYAARPLIGDVLGFGRSTDALPGARRLVIRTAVLLAVASVVCAAAFLAIDPSGTALREYPGIAQSYSGGAHNVPIYPHLPLLSLTLVTVTGLAVLIEMVRRRPDARLAPAITAYALIALMTQRAAFGAAEPSHFAYFGLPAICIAIFAVSSTTAFRGAAAWLAAVLLVGIMLPMQFYHFMEFVPFVTQRLSAATPAPLDEVGGAGESGAALEQDLRRVVDTLGTARPYVMYEMEYNSLPVYRDAGLKYATYFTFLNTARDFDGIDQVIAEIRRDRAIVVLREQDLNGLTQSHHSTGAIKFFDTLSGAHTAGSELNRVLLRSKSRLMAPFLRFVREECVPVYRGHGLIAVSPKQDQSKS